MLFLRHVLPASVCPSETFDHHRTYSEGPDGPVGPEGPEGPTLMGAILVKRAV